MSELNWNIETVKFEAITVGALLDMPNYEAEDLVNTLSAYLDSILAAVDVIEEQIKDYNLLEIHMAAKFLKASSREVGAHNMEKLYEILERESSSINLASVTGLRYAATRIRAAIPKVEQEINLLMQWQR